MECEEPEINSSLGYTKRGAICAQIAKSYKIEQFAVINHMKEAKNMAVIIVAPRRGGKTTIMKDLLSQVYSWYSAVYVFSETVELQPKMFNFCPEENICNSFDEEKMIKIYEQQKERVMKLKMLGVKIIPYILFIFDDCIGDQKIRSSKTFIKLFTQSRHLNCGVIVLSQEVGGKYGINKVCRANADIMIAFNLPSENDRELIVSQYLSTINKTIGHELFDRICSIKYNAIIICNFKISKNPEEYVYQYIADEKVPKFIIDKKGNGRLPDVKSLSYGANIQNTSFFKYETKDSKPKFKVNKINDEYNTLYGNKLFEV